MIKASCPNIKGYIHNVPSGVSRFLRSKHGMKGARYSLKVVTTDLPLKWPLRMPSSSRGTQKRIP